MSDYDKGQTALFRKLSQIIAEKVHFVKCPNIVVQTT